MLFDAPNVNYVWFHLHSHVIEFKLPYQDGEVVRTLLQMFNFPGKLNSSKPLISLSLLLCVFMHRKAKYPSKYLNFTQEASQTPYFFTLRCHTWYYTWLCLMFIHWIAPQPYCRVMLPWRPLFYLHHIWLIHF